MKKSNLIAGVGSVAVGVVCMLIALLTETKLDGIFWGLAGAGIAPGAMNIFQYFHWNAPENRAYYETMLENKRIEMNVWYTRNYSLWLDIKILFMTVFKVLTNADNVNDGATLK